MCASCLFLGPNPKMSRMPPGLTALHIPVLGTEWSPGKQELMETYPRDESMFLYLLSCPGGGLTGYLVNPGRPPTSDSLS